MGDVIRLHSEKMDEENWLSGMAHCIRCGYEWVAVAPVGSIWLYCPGCGCLAGAYQGCVRNGDARWTCNCGNYLFALNENMELYCPNCGTVQDIWDDE